MCQYDIKLKYPLHLLCSLNVPEVQECTTLARNFFIAISWKDRRIISGCPITEPTFTMCFKMEFETLLQNMFL